jgi:hypothetical protein
MKCVCRCNVSKGPRVGKSGYQVQNGSGGQESCEGAQQGGLACNDKRVN